MSDFRVVGVESLNENFFKAIGSDWMLVTARDNEAINMMTASWGGVGVLWNRSVCTIFVRKSRHTFGLIEKSLGFTLCFFDERYRDKLEYCGRYSGRDKDKVKECNLNPVMEGENLTYFEEAKMVLCCQVLYFHDMESLYIIDRGILQNFYPDGDLHRLYIGEITKCMVKGG